MPNAHQFSLTVQEEREGKTFSLESLDSVGSLGNFALQLSVLL